ncbi:class I tRNA ligase family protein, partial [Candidatus Methanodesulfokora washburnensis]
CARKRGIGTRLPFDEEWIIESLSDSTIYMALYTVMHRIRGLGIEDMENDFWDYIFLGNGDPEKIAEKLGIRKEDVEGMRREFLYWYPVDMRHTAIAHISNHLTFFIFHHVAIFPEGLWPRKITLNDLVIREGEKMAKSKGNVIPLANIGRSYSADWFRLYVVSAADLKTVLDWREEEMRTVGGRLEKFFRMAEEIMRMEGGKGKEIMTKWFITRVNKAIKEVDKCYSSHMYREAVVRGFFDMMRDFETYMRYGGADSAVLRDMLNKWIRIISPVIPHTAEELWHMMGEKGYVSAARWPEAEEVDEDAELAFEMAESTVEDVNKIIRTLKAKPRKLYIYVAPEWKYNLASKLSKLKSPVNPKEAFDIAKDYMKMGEEARKLVEEFIKGQVIKFSKREYELKILSELKDMIKERTGVEEVHVVEAEKAEYDPKNRAKLAIPGRPALYIE